MTNEELTNQVNAHAQAISDLIAFLDREDDKIPPSVRMADDPDPEGEEYEPGMNIGEGLAFPGLDRRWLSIAVTDFQRGFMALRRAIEPGDVF